MRLKPAGNLMTALSRSVKSGDAIPQSRSAGFCRKSIFVFIIYLTALSDYGIRISPCFPSSCLFSGWVCLEPRYSRFGRFPFFMALSFWWF